MLKRQLLVFISRHVTGQKEDGVCDTDGSSYGFSSIPCLPCSVTQVHSSRAQISWQRQMFIECPNACSPVLHLPYHGQAGCPCLWTSLKGTVEGEKPPGMMLAGKCFNQMCVLGMSPWEQGGERLPESGDDAGSWGR